MGRGNGLELSTSSAGVEIMPFRDELVTLTPLEARAFAAALVVGAEEVERIRSRAIFDSARPGETP